MRMEGKRPSVIAKELDMPVQSVKSILARSSQDFPSIPKGRPSIPKEPTQPRITEVIESGIADGEVIHTMEMPDMSRIGEEPRPLPPPPPPSEPEVTSAPEPVAQPSQDTLPKGKGKRVRVEEPEPVERPAQRQRPDITDDPNGASIMDQITKSVQEKFKEPVRAKQAMVSAADQVRAQQQQQVHQQQQPNPDVPFSGQGRMMTTEEGAQAFRIVQLVRKYVMHFEDELKQDVMMGKSRKDFMQGVGTMSLADLVALMQTIRFHLAAVRGMGYIEGAIVGATQVAEKYGPVIGVKTQGLVREVVDNPEFKDLVKELTCETTYTNWVHPKWRMAAHVLQKAAVCHSRAVSQKRLSSSLEKWGNNPPPEDIAAMAADL